MPLTEANTIEQTVVDAYIPLGWRAYIVHQPYQIPKSP